MKTRAARTQALPPLTRLGKLFIAVLLIAVLEGAIRKWFASSLTLPLVLARDLLALYAIGYALRRNLVSTHWLSFKLLLIWSCGVIAWGMLQTLYTQTSPVVLVIGLRFWLLYFWFAYVVAMGMQREDFRRSTMVVLYLLIAMTPLIVLQQASPPGAFINTQIDTDERDIFVVVAGIVRPTGTFSFTLGYTTFLAMAMPLVLSLQAIAPLTRRTRLVFVLAFVSLLVGSLLSGSRGALISYGAMLAVYLLGSLWFARGRTKLYALVALIGSVTLLALAGLAFHDAIEATQQRFSAAADAEDFMTRVVTIFVGEPQVYQRFSWLGHGLGAGSNLAGVFQSGERDFALAETEAARTLLEGGLMGLLFIAIKLALIAGGLRKAWQVSALNGSPGALIAWLTVAIALLTWSSIGQLTVNALSGCLLAFGILMLRFPSSVGARRKFMPPPRPFGRNARPERPMSGAAARVKTS